MTQNQESDTVDAMVAEPAREVLKGSLAKL